jgi:D,D-heptose 1,7-bisphosphate phosphatase
MAELRTVTTAMILAGGLGTRLRAVVSDRPKVLAPVAERRFLAYLLDQLADADFLDVVICTGYLGEQVREAFGERWRRLRLVYSQEPQPLGTAGALRLALDQVKAPRAIVVNGDSFCDVDFHSLTEFHRANHADATLTITKTPDANRFGSVEVGEAGEVKSFSEKGRAAADWINAGIYIIEREMIASIPIATQVSLERDCFPKWTEKRLLSHPNNGRFLDIGTPESFQAAQSFFMPADCDGRRPYAVLDRDGTINVERHYLSDPDQLELLPGAVEGMRKLRAHGFGLVVISNQAGIGRGYITGHQLEAIHERLRNLLGAQDLALDGIYFCPHLPEEGCTCRKPEIGLVRQAAADLGFDPSLCFVVGDKRCDIDMGARLRATTLLVRTGYGNQALVEGVTPDHIVDNLSDAADVIVRDYKSRLRPVH